MKVSESLPTMVNPCSPSLACMSPWSSAVRMDRDSLSTTGRGVLAGAKTPYQVETSKSLKPDSASVGI
ncbi:hypothetical protein D3C72_2465470 [compost metagenome]